MFRQLVNCMKCNERRSRVRKGHSKFTTWRYEEDAIGGDTASILFPRYFSQKGLSSLRMIWVVSIPHVPSAIGLPFNILFHNPQTDDPSMVLPALSIRGLIMLSQENQQDSAVPFRVRTPIHSPARVHSRCSGSKHLMPLSTCGTRAQSCKHRCKRQRHQDLPVTVRMSNSVQDHDRTHDQAYQDHGVNKCDEGLKAFFIKQL